MHTPEAHISQQLLPADAHQALPPLSHLFAPEQVQQHALGQFEVCITLKLVTHKQDGRLQAAVTAGASV
jgi:hypothetical protein